MDPDTVNETLRQAYYDPKIGLLSKTKFKQKIRQLHPEIRAKDIDAFLSKQALAQVNAPSKFQGFYKIVEPPKHYQVDIMFMSGYKRQNSNISMFLIVVDILSRKLWLFPMKTKTQEAIVEALKKFTKAEPEALALFADDEFAAAKIVAYCDEAGLMLTTDVAKDDHYDKGDRLGIVDRATRTVKTLIRNYMLANDTARYLPKLQELVANYNSTPHTALRGRSPDQAYEDLEFQKELYARYSDHNRGLQARVALQVGDHVRRRVDRGAFDKEGARFSSDIFIIDSRVGFKYRIRDAQGALQPRKYKYFELQKVSPAEVEGKAAEGGRAQAEGQSRRVRRLRHELGVTEKEAEDAIRQVGRPNTRSQTRRRAP